MNAGSALFKWIVLLVIIGLVLLCGGVALVRHEQHVGPGQEIIWEDFGFSVLEHHTETKIGDLVPRGTFHVVRLEVRNHAKRVPYRVDNHRAVLLDEQGGRYPVDRAAEKVLDPAWPHRHEIEPDATFASDLVFDVPRERQRLRLCITWGGPLIEFIDRNVFGQRDITLP